MAETTQVAVKQVSLLIDKFGSIYFVHDDDVARSLRNICEMTDQTQIKRASHVEPDDNGNWWADLSPCGGPNMGPFAERKAALDAEKGWILANMREAIDHLYQDGSP